MSILESPADSGRGVMADHEIDWLKELEQRFADELGDSTYELTLRSMTEILFRDFRMSAVTPGLRVRNDGRFIEVGIFAWSNDPAGDMFKVTITRQLQEEDIQEVQNLLRDFRDASPQETHGRKIYAILAAEEIPDDLGKKVLQEGIYLARIHDGQFEIQVPESFHARAF
jgi:hypothetical protein